MSHDDASNDYPVTRRDGGLDARWYGLRFGKDGICTSPETRARLLDDAASGDYSDVFVISHGWNNPWDDANRLYDDFLKEFHTLVAKHGLGEGRRYRPLWVGVYWPSAILVFPWEQGPEIAAGNVADQAEVAREIAVLGDALNAAELGQLAALGAKESLGPDEAELLARLVLQAVPARVDAEWTAWAPPDDPEALLKAWGPVATDTDESGLPGEPTFDHERAEPGTAAGFRLRNPRTYLRSATVWLMKDRAGLVGENGVGPLISDLDRRMKEARSGAKVHLIGHSFGCKVQLSAVSSAAFAGRQVESVLLLEPAISARCFAADAINGRPGGYREALSRVRQPILTTYSDEDQELHDAFHLAVCRRYDIGEAGPATAAPVNLFAALGGYGPQRSGADADSTPIRLPDATYDLEHVAARVLALDGSGVIHSHGDVTNPATGWALREQVAYRR